MIISELPFNLHIKIKWVTDLQILQKVFLLFLEQKMFVYEPRFLIPLNSPIFDGFFNLFSFIVTV